MPAEIIDLLHYLDKTSTRSATDALFDTSDRALAERLGVRARLLMQSPTADVKHTVRLAVSYAARALDSCEALARLATTEVVH